MPVATGSQQATYIGGNTGGITSLASSSTWTAGYEWITFDYSSTMNIPTDVRITLGITVGTTPTINTEIRVYLVPAFVVASTLFWPDVFDGTPSAETWTSEGMRDSVAVLAATLRVDSTTTARLYWADFSVRQLFGGTIPPGFAVFITHNTGAALNATAGNHTYYITQYADLLTYG